MNKPYTKIDSWVKNIIVDPLGKEPLIFSEDGNKRFLKTNYNKKYPIIDGVYDLRLLMGGFTNDQKIWLEGQKE